METSISGAQQLTHGNIWFAYSNTILTNPSPPKDEKRMRDLRLKSRELHRIIGRFADGRVTGLPCANTPNRPMW